MIAQAIRQSTSVDGQNLSPSINFYFLPFARDITTFAICDSG